MIKEDFSEEVTYEQRPQGSPNDMRDQAEERELLSGHKRKDSETGLGLAILRNKEKNFSIIL